jgi:hypothetical protein
MGSVGVIGSRAFRNGGVQVEAVENLSAVVHREQFDSFGGVGQSSRRASTHIALALHAI